MESRACNKHIKYKKKQLGTNNIFSIKQLTYFILYKLKAN